MGVRVWCWGGEYGVGVRGRCGDENKFGGVRARYEDGEVGIRGDGKV